MRIDAFLQESPMFAVSRTARSFEALANRAFAADDLNFLEGLILTAIFFEAPLQVKPSQLAEVFSTTRGNISHSISSLEGKGLIQRKIDPLDARAYLLALKPPGKKCAMRVISALDKLQRDFEKKAGKTALKEALSVMRVLEEIATSSQE